MYVQACTRLVILSKKKKWYTYTNLRLHPLKTINYGLVCVVNGNSFCWLSLAHNSKKDFLNNLCGKFMKHFA